MEGGRCITTEFSFTAFLDCHYVTTGCLCTACGEKWFVAHTTQQLEHIARARHHVGGQ